MAGITTNDVIIAMKKGSAWGTAVDVSGGFKLRCSALTLSGGFEEFLSRDVGFAKLLQDTSRLTFSGNISITCDLTANQPWLALLASVMGAEGTASAEITASQGDYSHDIDIANSLSAAPFWTIAWAIEDSTEIIELPSCMFNSFSISSDANNVGTVTFGGVFTKVAQATTVSDYADVTGVTGTTYEAFVLTGANAYFRMNAQGGDALDSGDNLGIETYTISVNRPIRPQHVLQGVESPYIIRPKDIDRIDGTLSFRLSEINHAVLDGITEWLAKTNKKAELFFDGSAIGTGVNRSLKFMFPRLQPLSEIPSGYDIPNNNSLMAPTYGYRMLEATAAPTGMTGVTKLMRVTSIDERATKWTA